jgi:methionine-rich copper-binding protein CopC
MKKLAICLLTACLSLTVLPSQAIAAPVITKTFTPANSSDAERVKTLELRLNEIKAMDKSKMKASEKKKLRKEVKSINRDIHDIGGGVYISAGAIIVVLILLLVLL